MVTNLKSAADIALSAHREYEQERDRSRRESEERRQQEKEAERKRAESEARRRLGKSLLAEWFPEDTNWEYVETWVDPRHDLRWDVWTSGDPSEVCGQVQLMTNVTSAPDLRQVWYVTRYNGSYVTRYNGRALRSERWDRVRVYSLREIGRMIQDRIDESRREAVTGKID